MNLKISIIDSSGEFPSYHSCFQLNTYVTKLSPLVFKLTIVFPSYICFQIHIFVSNLILFPVLRIETKTDKPFFSSIAWIIKMEKIHYERQNKLEEIATEMYKNSVLVCFLEYFHFYLEQKTCPEIKIKSFKSDE